MNEKEIRNLFRGVFVDHEHECTGENKDSIRKKLDSNTRTLLPGIIQAIKDISENKK